MKKLVLLLILAFSFVSLGNAKQEKKDVKQCYVGNVCADIADAITANHCGYSDCDDTWWNYAYNECVNA